MDVIKIYSNACCHSEKFLSDILISTRRTDTALNTTQSNPASRWQLAPSKASVLLFFCGLWWSHERWNGLVYCENWKGGCHKYFYLFIAMTRGSPVCARKKRNEIVSYYEGGKICSYGLMRALVIRKITSRKLNAPHHTHPPPPPPHTPTLPIPNCYLQSCWVLTWCHWIMN